MKKILSFTLKFLISGGLLLYLFQFSDIVDVSGVVSTLKHTKLPLFVIAFFVYLNVIFISTQRWSLFLHEPVKYTRLLSLHFIGSFFNTFLPGLVGGDAVKAFYLYKDIGKGSHSVISVFIDRYMGFSAMIFIGFIAFIGGFFYIKGTEIVWIVPVLCGGFILVSLVLWKLNWGKIKFLNSFYIPLMGYKSKKKLIYKGLLLGIAVQVINIMSVYILSLAIGLKVPIIYFFIFMPVISAVSAIPISIAGLGLRETSFAALFNIVFAKVGVTPDQAVGLSVLVFINTCLVNLIGGVEYLRIKKLPKKKSLKSEV